MHEVRGHVLMKRRGCRRSVWNKGMGGTWRRVSPFAGTNTPVSKSYKQAV